MPECCSSTSTFKSTWSGEFGIRAGLTSTVLKKPVRSKRILDRSIFSLLANAPSIWRISRRNTSSAVLLLPLKLIRRTLTC